MRHRKRSNIIIELTPLLDVIMILIFIIMTNNSEKVIEAQEATDRAKTNAEKAAKEYEARISEKDLEYSSALEKLNSELESVRVSAEETEAAKDAEIAQLTDSLTKANIQLESDEYLREYLYSKAAQIDGYESLIKIVKVVNIFLINDNGEDYDNIVLNAGLLRDTLICEYSVDSSIKMSPIPIYTYLSPNEAEKIENQHSKDYAVTN